MELLEHMASLRASSPLSHRLDLQKISVNRLFSSDLTFCALINTQCERRISAFLNVWIRL